MYGYEFQVEVTTAYGVEMLTVVVAGPHQGDAAQEALKQKTGSELELSRFFPQDETEDEAHYDAVHAPFKCKVIGQGKAV